MAIKPDSEKAWDSQGSILRSADAIDRRSRWSFLAWHDFTAKKTEDGVEKEIKPCPESIEEERLKTTHKMTAYVLSTGEGDSTLEKANSHRRKPSTETEALCYQGKATGRVSPILSSSQEAR